MKFHYGLERDCGVLTANLGFPDSPDRLTAWWAGWLKALCQSWLPPTDQYLIQAGRPFVAAGYTRAQIVAAMCERGATKQQAIYCAAMALSYGRNA